MELDKGPVMSTGFFFFFLFDDSNIHCTHAHTVWGGQRGFEPLSNRREFSLCQMPSGPVMSTG